MTRPPLPLLACVGLLVVGHLIMWLRMPLAIEDAYIAFRYARNLTEGHGLVYNLGERVMGFTSLPWTLWCALGMLLHVDPVAWTRATSLAADLGTLVLGWRLMPGRAGVTFAVFFAAWPMFAAGAGSGLECSAFLSLILFSAWLTRERPRYGSSGVQFPWAGCVLGLLAIMRPEGLVAAAVIAIAANWRARLVAAGIVLAALIFTTTYYGSPIPQSVLAKAAVYGTPGPWAGPCWWEWLMPGLISGHSPIAADFNPLLPLMVLFVAAAASGAIYFSGWLRHPAAVAAEAGLAVWLGYIVAGPAYFWWYMIAPLGALSLLAAVGLARIVNGRTLPIAALVMLLGAWHAALLFYGGRASSEANFAKVAGFIADNARPGDSVFLEPIGCVGYLTGLQVLDEVGLVSPEVAQRRVRGGGWYGDEVAAHSPTWLVTRPGFFASGEAFAGAGLPFRSAEQREATLSRYLKVGGGAVEIYWRRP